MIWPLQAGQSGCLQRSIGAAERERRFELPLDDIVLLQKALQAAPGRLAQLSYKAACRPLLPLPLPNPHCSACFCFANSPGVEWVRLHAKMGHLTYKM